MNLAGPGACDPESILTSSTGSGQYTWPINANSGDQEYPGMLIYSRESEEPVLASDWGTVIFAGESLKDGSLAVVLDHGNGYQTLYGNLKRVNVGCGESVTQGQTIGWLDDSSGGKQPYLSFAIFNQGIPFPPLQKLSGRP
jgi:septal ring factor EnvC (AmiA/AmiB activator)